MHDANPFRLSRSLYRNRVAGWLEWLLYLALLGLFVIYMLPVLEARMVWLLVWAASTVAASVALLIYWLVQRRRG